MRRWNSSPWSRSSKVSGMLPQDPIILLSFVNTKLRDEYPSLDELCAALDADREELLRKLESVGYAYAEERNQFI